MFFFCVLFLDTTMTMLTAMTTWPTVAAAFELINIRVACRIVGMLLPSSRCGALLHLVETRKVILPRQVSATGVYAYCGKALKYDTL